MHVREGFAILLTLVGIASPVVVIGVVYYLKKRLEHRQIMAAVEKGTSLAELLRPKPAGPAWIRPLSVGIAILVIAIGFAVSPHFEVVVAFVLGGVGAGCVVRGVLCREYDARSRNLATDSAADSVTS